MLIAVTCNLYVDEVPVLSDTVGTNDSWTEVESGIYAQDHNLRVFYLNNCAAGSCTMRATWSDGGSYAALSIIPVTGLAASLPFDDAVFNAQDAPGLGTDAVTSGNTNTLAQQPAMVFGFARNHEGAGEVNTGTGFTSIANPSFIRIQHKRVTATTAVAATFTASSSMAAVLSSTIIRRVAPMSSPAREVTPCLRTLAAACLTSPMQGGSASITPMACRG